MRINLSGQMEHSLRRVLLPIELEDDAPSYRHRDMWGVATGIIPTKRTETVSTRYLMSCVFDEGRDRERPSNATTVYTAISRFRVVCTALVLFLVLLSLSGCVGAVVRSVRTESTPFSEKQQRAGPPPAGQARVWVYGVGGGPKVWNTEGRRGFITFNQTAYWLGGNTYFYVELPPGNYRLTTTEACQEVLRWKYMAAKCKLGKIQKNVSFQEGQEHFIRIQFPTSGKEFPFDEVDSSQASSEMQSLKYWKLWELEEVSWVEQ